MEKLQRSPCHPEGCAGWPGLKPVTVGWFGPSSSCSCPGELLAPSKAVSLLRAEEGAQGPAPCAPGPVPLLVLCSGLGSVTSPVPGHCHQPCPWAVSPALSLAGWPGSAPRTGTRCLGSGRAAPKGCLVLVCDPCRSLTQAHRFLRHVPAHPHSTQQTPARLWPGHSTCAKPDLTTPCSSRNPTALPDKSPSASKRF